LHGEQRLYLLPAKNRQSILPLEDAFRERVEFLYGGVFLFDTGSARSDSTAGKDAAVNQYIPLRPEAIKLCK
jgi:hypothetical protein